MIYSFLLKCFILFFSNDLFLSNKFFIFRPRNFLEAGFRPLCPPLVYFVPLSRTKPAFRISTRTAPGHFSQVLSARSFLVAGFDTLNIPRSFSCGFIKDLFFFSNDLSFMIVLLLKWFIVYSDDLFFSSQMIRSFPFFSNNFFFLSQMIHSSQMIYLFFYWFFYLYSSQMIDSFRLKCIILFFSNDLFFSNKFFIFFLNDLCFFSNHLSFMIVLLLK